MLTTMFEDSRLAWGMVPKNNEALCPCFNGAGQCQCKRGKVSAQAGSGIPALQMISRSLCLDLSRACHSVLISDGEAGWPHLFSSATGQGQYTPALSGNIFPAAVFRPA